MGLDRGGQEVQNEPMYSENRMENGGEIRVRKTGVFFDFF